MVDRTNTLYLGTSVISVTGKAIVVQTGKQTEFGKVSERLKLRPPETEFETGLSKFGYFLMEVTLTLVVLICVANVYLQRPVLESFLFSLALAVGLTPQLLPAIVSVNLARGAKQMAKKQVIVKRLPAIENFVSVPVLYRQNRHADRRGSEDSRGGRCGRERERWRSLDAGESRSVIRLFECCI